ncbi:MAG: hypothetical protein V7640_3295 [Betaproteobacteria bacterium]
MRLVTFSDAQGMRIGVHDAQSDSIVAWRPAADCRAT